MLSFILRRIGLFCCSFFVLTLLIFWVHVRLDSEALLRFVPEYINYTSKLIYLDWGNNVETGAKIYDEIKLYFPQTFELIFISLSLALLLGTFLGIICGLNHHSKLDKILGLFCQLTNSIPVYWLAQIFIIIFAIKLKMLPTTGNMNLLYTIPNTTGISLIDALLTINPIIIKDAFLHLIMPVCTLMIMPCAEITSIIRKATIDVTKKNFFQAAQIRGMNVIKLAYKHVFPNVIQSVLPHTSIIICNLFSACILVEVVFEWPGIGLWLIQSVTASQYSNIEPCVFFLAICLLIINIGTEILCALFFKNNRNISRTEDAM